MLTVALAGNPNVGKSTVFNALTGLNQHTGNWPGKTVDLFYAHVSHNGQDYRLVDLPGTYSLRTHSLEEEVARDYLIAERPDLVVCVVDATSLERNLCLVLQILPLARRTLVCLNLMDEALKKGLSIDAKRLSEELGVPVVPAAARSKIGMPELTEHISRMLNTREQPGHAVFEEPQDMTVLYRRCEEIAAAATVKLGERTEDLTNKIDDIVTSKRVGIPLMLCLLGFVFAITIGLANYPSDLLARILFFFEGKLSGIASFLGLHPWLHGLLIHGTYRTSAWVVAVMLPPMAIFFPLFTFLEDLGYLPRIAFNLDHLFCSAGGHGKQALTMSMGFGCNAAGVVAARIIESPRERLIAILTNNFVPCNGRFPMIIAICTIFFGGSKTLWAPVSVVAIVVFGVGVTLGVSWLLSKTLLKGVPSSFILELPPYRKPDLLQVVVRSFKDRTVWVLKRAVAVAAPFGAITWILSNTLVKGQSLTGHLAGLLDPAASLMGMDGVILTAFLLGFPANEIVLPVALMGYLSQGTLSEPGALSFVGSVLTSNGWTYVTAVSVLIFALCHFPCGTTVYTVMKETGSKKWALLSALIPTAVGAVILVVLNFLFRAFGLI